MANFTAEEIVKASRCHEKYSFNDCAFELHLRAANLTDGLLRKLRALCAVCPADKQNPCDCEIIGTC